jgi:hypothetical protein
MKPKFKNPFITEWQIAIPGKSVSYNKESNTHTFEWEVRSRKSGRSLFVIATINDMKRWMAGTKWFMDRQYDKTRLTIQQLGKLKRV